LQQTNSIQNIINNESSFFNKVKIEKHKHIFREIHHHILYRQHLREVPTETLRWGKVFETRGRVV